jgi:hypothetical protein
MTMEERTQLIDELIQEDRDVTIGDYLDVRQAENEIYKLLGIIKV